MAADTATLLFLFLHHLDAERISSIMCSQMTMFSAKHEPPKNGRGAPSCRGGHFACRHVQLVQYTAAAANHGRKNERKGMKITLRRPRMSLVPKDDASPSPVRSNRRSSPLSENTTEEPAATAPRSRLSTSAAASHAGARLSVSSESSRITPGGGDALRAVSPHLQSVQEGHGLQLLSNMTHQDIVQRYVQAFREGASKVWGCLCFSFRRSKKKEEPWFECRLSARHCQKKLIHACLIHSTATSARCRRPIFFWWAKREWARAQS